MNQGNDNQLQGILNELDRQDDCEFENINIKFANENNEEEEE